MIKQDYALFILTANILKTRRCKPEALTINFFPLLC